LLVAITNTLITAEFKSDWLDPSAWYAIYFVADLVVAVWLIEASLKRLRKRFTEEDVIRQLRNSDED